MEIPGNLLGGKETKLFDPQNASLGKGAELLDASVVRRDGQWWSTLPGNRADMAPRNSSALHSTPELPSPAHGWKLTQDEAGRIGASRRTDVSRAWDGSGGRHCPSYVRGWDPHKREWVERIYYAGAAENLWGPYTIGFLEWNGEAWIDQPRPVFDASEDWERGSVYEPNLIFHDGKWKMWYVPGSNRENYLVQGYAESDDGVTEWSAHTVFASPEMKMFDFCVRERAGSFDAIFARVWVGEGAPPAETGLWWCRAEKPSGILSDWSSPCRS